MFIGYARISTSDQSLNLQIDALKKNRCERLFSEIASGAKSDRPELQKALDFARKGDTIIVWKLDRLGRSLKHLVETVAVLESRGVHFQSLQEAINTSSAGGRLTFHLFSALAEFERALIQERTHAGLKAARARGRFGGRPRKISDADAKKINILLADKSTPITEICSTFHVSRSTLYRHINSLDT